MRLCKICGIREVRIDASGRKYEMCRECYRERRKNNPNRFRSKESREKLSKNLKLYYANLTEEDRTKISARSAKNLIAHNKSRKGKKDPDYSKKLKLKYGDDYFKLRYQKWWEKLSTEKKNEIKRKRVETTKRTHGENYYATIGFHRKSEEEKREIINRGVATRVNLPKEKKEEIKWKKIATQQKNGSNLYRASNTENSFYEFLVKSLPGIKIERQKHHIRFFIDFYLPKFDLFIQLDGVYWHGYSKVNGIWRLDYRRILPKLKKFKTSTLKLKMKNDLYQNKHIPNLIRFLDIEFLDKSACLTKLSAYISEEFIDFQGYRNEKYVNTDTLS